MAAAAQSPLSPIERAICTSYVSESHLRAIGTAARMGNFAVSFREAGELTLNLLSQGAACKGHNVLEKTIKPGSCPHESQEVMSQLARLGLMGAVGHRSPEGRLIGVYVSPDVADWAHSTDPAKARLGRQTQELNGAHWLPMDVNDLESSLQDLRQIPNFQRHLLTGDYDAHEMINFGGHRGHVPSNSDQERFIITAINHAVDAADPHRPLDQPQRHVVQHGPQFNYPAQMRAHEPDVGLVGAVAKPSFPIAMCNRGDWSIIKDQQGLEAFYAKNNLNIKSPWTADGPLQYLSDPDRPTHVLIGRRPSSSSDDQASLGSISRASSADRGVDRP